MPSRKKDNRLYAFLEHSGALETGNELIIREAKRQYWLEYKKNWNKKNLKDLKAYTIHFNQKELEVIKKAASKCNIMPTNFIKQCSLKKNQNILDPVAVGEIRELLALHFSIFQSLAEQERLPYDFANQILTRIANLENKVLGVLQK